MRMSASGLSSPAMRFTLTAAQPAQRWTSAHSPSGADGDGDRLHRAGARRGAVAGDDRVEVAAPQAARAVVSVLRARRGRGHVEVAVPAAEAVRHRDAGNGCADRATTGPPGRDSAETEDGRRARAGSAGGARRGVFRDDTHQTSPPASGRLTWRGRRSPEGRRTRAARRPRRDARAIVAADGRRGRRDAGPRTPAASDGARRRARGDGAGGLPRPRRLRRRAHRAGRAADAQRRRGAADGMWRTGRSGPAPGRIAVGATAITWDADDPPSWEPALAEVARRRASRCCGHARTRSRRRSADDSAAPAGGLIATDRGAEGLGHLTRAVATRDPAAAALAAERLTGLGGGLTPEGDDVLAATAAVVAAAGGAAGFGADDRARWLAALVPEETAQRTTALAATLLRLAARGRVIEPVHRLLDHGRDDAWRDALATLAATGASTGRAYAAGVALDARAPVRRRALVARGRRRRRAGRPPPRAARRTPGSPGRGP